ncbi:MAG: protein kinase, partial [Coxiellaceae bacterium]|nr:protein kinase [Coxiellaceae bacterium]
NGLPQRTFDVLSKYGFSNVSKLSSGVSGTTLMAIYTGDDLNVKAVCNADNQIIIKMMTIKPELTNDEALDKRSESEYQHAKMTNQNEVKIISALNRNNKKLSTLPKVGVLDIQGISLIINEPIYSNTYYKTSLTVRSFAKDSSDIDRRSTERGGIEKRINEFDQIGISSYKGVEELAANNLTHTDISIENFLLCEDGTVKTIDLGAALLIDPETKIAKNQGNFSLAPEHFHDQRALRGEVKDIEYTTDTDKFSHRCTMMHMIATYTGAKKRDIFDLKDQEGNKLTQRQEGELENNDRLTRYYKNLETHVGNLKQHEQGIRADVAQQFLQKHRDYLCDMQQTFGQTRQASVEGDVAGNKSPSPARPRWMAKAAAKLQAERHVDVSAEKRQAEVQQKQHSALPGWATKAVNDRAKQQPDATEKTAEIKTPEVHSHGMR